jgi:hypothetical protein
MRQDKTKQQPIGFYGWFASIPTRLIGFSRAMGRIPSLGYAAFYLFLIPVFAFIYYFLPDPFYHTTIQFERSLHTDEAVILQQLQKETIKTFENHNGAEAELSGWKLAADSISLRMLKVSASEISFQLEVELTKLSENKQRVYTSATIKGPLGQWAESVSGTDKEKDRKVIEYRTITIEASPVSPFSVQPSLAKVLFPESLPKLQLPKELFGELYEKAPGEKLIMPISRELNEKILDYQKGTEGFPSRVTGNLVRMFYLSASTITTLGYGDILPITTASRILVSVESIFGIVTIGLFLNALAYERDKVP